MRQYILLAAVVLFAHETIPAAKPDKPGGGGGDTAALYTLADLGGFTGGDFVQSWALGLNDPDPSGLLQVVGLSYVNRDEHAALWDVTAAGQVLAITDVAPPGYVQSRARKINNLGHALVGGFVLVPGQGLLELPGLGNGPGFPGALNDVGDIAGIVTDADGNEHGALWHITTVGEIQGPLVFDLGDGEFFVRDMNNSGMIAGGMIALGDLGGGRSSPCDINDAGQIVGETRTSSGWQLQVGFLWQDGMMFDLNQITDSGGGKRHLQIANAINNTGHVAGLLTLGKPVSEQHGFLLVPTTP